MNNSDTSNEARERARQIIEFTGTHLFLTGKAGTGKTTFLRQLKKDAPKRMVILAPTGIAAINAGGSTLHSFFQLPFAPFIPDAQYKTMNFRLQKRKIQLIRSLDLIVIDEISMVRADLLDQIDAVLRQYRNRYLPFGGVQLLMIGDLQQLAPVAKEEEWNLLSQYYDSPYFFSSHALQQTHYVTVELQKVYRQSDPTFLNLLNSIRSNQASEQVLAQLNRRYIPNFHPEPGEKYIRLVTHNSQAQQINENELRQLPADRSFTYQAKIEGNFPEYSFPTDAVLTLKLGAQVMFVKNDSEKRFYNGTLGEIIAISEKDCTVRTADRHIDVKLEPEEWLNTRYMLNDSTQQIEEKVEGSYHQLPVKLAWAITIHKSQGLTFEKAIIDAHAAFAHGQTYVALSRCKTLEGLVLSSPIPPSAIIQDSAVCQFNEKVAQQQPTEQSIDLMRQEHCLNLIGDLFDFSPIRNALNSVQRLMEIHFYQLFPQTLQEYQGWMPSFNGKVLAVADKFRRQYHRLVAESGPGDISTALQERLTKGAAYFYEQLAPLEKMARHMTLPTDNKELKKRTNNALEDLRSVLSQKCMLLAYVKSNGMELAPYQRCRALVLAGQPMLPDGSVDTAAQEAAGRKRTTEKLTIPAEIQHPDLYQILYNWRSQKAVAENVPTYMILQSKALVGISNVLPNDLRTLAKIPYFGSKSMESYGEELLEIIQRYIKDKHISEQQLSIFQTGTPMGTSTKESTLEISLRLFNEKRNLEEVARERGLTPATVQQHLVVAVQNGQLTLEDFMPVEHVRAIRTYLETLSDLKSVRLTEIFTALKEQYTFEEIRAVIKIYF